LQFKCRLDLKIARINTIVLYSPIFYIASFRGGGGVDLAKNRPGNLANRESEFRASLNEFTADRITSDSGQGFVFVRLSRAVIQK